MAFNYFTFNGQRLEDFGFIVKKSPEYVVAEKDITSEDIRGKDGNAIVFNNRYKNRTQTYKIISLPTRVDCSNRELINKLNYWLNTPTEYCKFTDTYNEGLYTEAYCVKLSNIKDLMEGVVEADVTFELKPFWYIDSVIQVFNAPTRKVYTLQNPTDYISYPKITIRADLSNIGLNININLHDSINIPAMSPSEVKEVIYDAESGDVTVDGINYNYLISNYNYPPHFGSGQNRVRVTNSASDGVIPYVLIEPRWRLL